eukprot:1129772-Alexandrium_andersonii.AAC.1
MGGLLAAWLLAHRYCSGTLCAARWTRCCRCRQSCCWYASQSVTVCGLSHRTCAATAVAVPAA